MTVDSIGVLLSITKMSEHIIVLVALSIILASAKADDYPNVESLRGLPSYRKKYEQHEPPSGGYGRNSPQVIHTNSARKRIQDEYAEAIGPVHTFVKTDEHAHFKWGVRHHIG